MMVYLAAICLALVLLVAYLLRHQNAERAEWTQERQLLISRIQHPELVFTTPEEARPDEEFLTSEPDDVDLVGTVQNGD